MQNNHLRDPFIFQVETILCYLVVFTGFFGVALLPLDIGPFKLFPYRVFYILLLLLFGIRIVFTEKMNIFGGRIKWFLVFLVFWLGYSVISLAWAMSRMDALKDIIFLFMGISLIFFICCYFQDKKELSRLYYLCFAAFACLVIIGFWETMTGSHLSSSMFFGYPSCFIPTSVFYNQNDFASFLALYIPFGIGLIFYTRRLILRVLGITSVLGAVYLIIITNCVSGLLAVILEVVVLFVLYVISKRKTCWLTALIPVVCAIVIWKYPLIHQYILQMASVGERANLIRNGLHFLSSTFGFGVGAGNIEYWMAYFAKYDTAEVLNIHNWWAEVLVGYGIYVFAGYVLFYLGIIYKLVRVRFSTAGQLERLFCETLILSLCGFFFACNGPSSFLNINAQWYIFGIALAFINTTASVEEQSCRALPSSC